jgi:predicted GIY-YIG superfamily endonuclease
VLLRDRLLRRLTEMGNAPDYVRLAEEVLGIRNAPPALAQRLVRQALVMEDRSAEWQRIGARLCAAAPPTPGVYVLRDASGSALYVGKTTNLRRRFRTHFAPRRWRALKPEFARAVDADWQEVGSELEALLREAEWIQRLAPLVNVQVGLPALNTRDIPSALLRDVIVVQPSVEADSVELVAARVDGPAIIQRTRRSGADLGVHASRLWKFGKPGHARQAGLAGQVGQTSPLLLSPIVFSWLAGRGAHATRIEMSDVVSAKDLRGRLATILDAPELFSERIVVLNSMFRSAPRSAARAQVGPLLKRP